MNNSNESPFSNPKFLQAIVIVFIGLWGWQYFMGKNYPQPLPPVKSATPAGVPETSKAAVEAKTQAAQATATAPAATLAPQVEKEIRFEDNNVVWSISSVGMGLKNFTLKKYKDRSQKQIQFNSQDNLFSVFANNQKINFNLTQVSETEIRGDGLVDGKKIVRTLKYDKTKMNFESKTEFDPGLTALFFSIDEKKLKIETSMFMPSFERQEFLYRGEKDKIVAEPISSLKDEEVFNHRAGSVTLASIGTQYFTAAAIDKSEIMPSANMTVQAGQARLQMIYDVANTQARLIRQLYFVGAKDPDVLKQIDPVMPEVMDYGIFGFIAKPLLILMKFMHSLLGNWGLAIIGLTLVVRVVLLPFNIMSFKSARAMQRIQPLLKNIREKYKSDPLKVNRETMALMKEHKANPLSGCLPMFIQIPIFFALWKTIGSSVEIYQQPFFGWIQDLSSYDPFFVIPVLMGVTMFFQQKLTPTTIDPMQQKILNFMPIIFTVFMFSLPSGLTLYNFVSALFGVVQQYFLLKDTSAKAV